MSMDELIEEMIFARVYVRDLPQSLVIAFADTFDGLSEDDVRRKQQEIYEMYRPSLDKSLLNLKIAVQNTVDIICKADGINVKQDGTVMLRTRGNTVLIGTIDQFGDTLEEVENNLTEWLLLTVTKGDPKLPFDNAKIVEVEPLSRYRDTSNARRILSKVERPIDALLIAFGVKPCFETYRLYLPRFLTLFFYDGRPIHVVQLTNTDSGKSHYSVRMEFVDNWTHFTEFPSPAKLIFDGRTGMKGAVFTSRGIIVDEFDKIKKDRFVEAYQPLNTGLENGIWRRGVQAMTGVSLEGYKFVPFLLMGNIVQGEEPLSNIFNENTRNYLTTKLDNVTGFSTYSFVERFALIDILPQKIPISKYLIRNEKGIVGVFKDAIIRGLITEIENSIPTKFLDCDGRLEGRLRRHGEAVWNTYTALIGEEPCDEEFFVNVILGEITIGNLLAGIFEKKPQSEAISSLSFDLSDSLRV